MSLIGLDLNATRVRAVRGLLGDYPRTMPLAPPLADLPMVVSLEGKTPVVGAAGLRVCRLSPRLAWQNFLPLLGKSHPPNGKWAARPGLDAAKALGLALAQTARSSRGSDGVVLALPSYLSVAQIETVLGIASQAGLPVLGSIASPLAEALAAHAEQSWFGATIVIDIDDQALTLATIRSDQGQAQVLSVTAMPTLNRRVWQERLLNAIADCFILDSRWDPRESAVAEQFLYDQLDGLLDSAQHGRTCQVAVRSAQRFQNLMLQPQDPAAFCAHLRRQAMVALESILAAPWPDGTPSTVVLTADAARLPGLAPALEVYLDQAAAAEVNRAKQSLSTLEDFGTGLLDADSGAPTSVVVTADGAAARGAHSVAAYFHRGDIPSGHLPTAAPLPLPQMRTTA